MQHKDQIVGEQFTTTPMIISQIPSFETSLNFGAFASFTCHGPIPES